MRKFYCLLVLSALLISHLSSATTRRVLFIGNSYIYTNDVPNILSQLATSLGDTLIYDQSTPGGWTLQAHSTDANTLTKIYSQQWDVVVIQEQSQRPAFHPSQVATDTYPYAHILDSLVHDNNACSETMFMMTWGYKNGDPSNCGSYPVICTYAGMQMRLRESYLEMALDNNANVAPVGAAWKMTRDSFPSIELYSGDNSHPVVAGSYLEACVLYASIFHRSPALSTYYSTLADTTAVKLQGVARHVVLDSLENWQQHGNYVFSGFGLSINDKTITLQNNSQRATTYTWNFGDGNTSNAAAPAPHTYAAYGTYNVTLTASNSCLSETKTQAIAVYPVSVWNTEKENTAISISTEAGGKVNIQTNTTWDRLEIFDISGRKLYSYCQHRPSISLELAPGIYVIRSGDHGHIQSRKFAVN